MDPGSVTVRYPDGHTERWLSRKFPIGGQKILREGTKYIVVAIGTGDHTVALGRHEPPRAAEEVPTT